jgi:protein tyrosine/serine phosphatase
MLQVEGGLYRSARPQPAQFAEIKQTFKRILSLEGWVEDRKEADELAPVLVLSDSITFADIYFTGITQARLDFILQEIDAGLSFGKLLVHCERGQDRTGLVIASYRVRKCGWTKEAAMAEALTLGYRKYLNFGLNKTWANFA